jgi:hypothetical protein
VTATYHSPTDVTWREAWAADFRWSLGWHLKVGFVAASTVLLTAVLLGLAVAHPFARPGHPAGGLVVSAVIGTIGLVFAWATMGVVRDGLRVLAPLWRGARVDEGAVTARAMTPATRHSFAEYWITVGAVRLLIPRSVYEAVAVGTKVRVEHGGSGGPARRVWL